MNYFYNLYYFIFISNMLFCFYYYFHYNSILFNLLFKSVLGFMLHALNVNLAYFFEKKNQTEVF